jgi:hypothetical protein
MDPQQRILGILGGTPNALNDGDIPAFNACSCFRPLMVSRDGGAL